MCTRISQEGVPTRVSVSSSAKSQGAEGGLLPRLPLQREPSHLRGLEVCMQGTVNWAKDATIAGTAFSLRVCKARETSVICVALRKRCV